MPTEKVTFPHTKVNGGKIVQKKKGWKDTPDPGGQQKTKISVETHKQVKATEGGREKAEKKRQGKKIKFSGTKKKALSTPK